MGTGFERRGNLILLAPDKLAAILQVSTTTLENWRWRRRGPRWTKIGRKVLYRLSHVQEWLDRQTVS